MTWKTWARGQIKDPTSPSTLTREGLAALTGQDVRALDVFVECLKLYAAGDRHGRRAALYAGREVLRAMQPSTRWVARELIPYVLDWTDTRIWPLFTDAGELEKAWP